jgi:hypothetical protein
MALTVAIPPASQAANSPATAAAHPRVVLVLVPQDVSPEDLTRLVPGISPGAISAGLSKVSPTQTYLDISQGNRIFTSLYPDELPASLAVRGAVPGWRAIVKRSADAPANLIPGLLGGSLASAGVPIHVDPSLRTPALIAAERDGHVGRGPAHECIDAACPPGFDLVLANLVDLPAIAGRLHGDDLLIAMERPPPPPRELLTLGIAGRGFDGNLTSSTTRSNGLVTTTDLGPTILRRFGVEAPDQMSGRPIRSEGSVDAAAVSSRAQRLSVIGARRNPVIFTNALLWLLAAVTAIVVSRGRAARKVLPLLALACVYLPLLLLLGAALEPSRLGERLIVGLGAPLLGLLTLRFVRGYAALAVACALTVGAYALDVIAGSPLSSLSLIGPNPAIGVRFFGIGNELEATIAVLVPVGVGAAVAAWSRGRIDAQARRTAVLAFLGAGAVTGVIFGLGRFGADVGAVIVLPIGAAVAAAVVSGVGGRRRTLLLVLAAPVLALAALAALDLALGGGAHLTSSVLRGGGASSLGDVFDRRLRLSVKSFGHNAGSPYLYLSAVVIVLTVVKRRTIAAWFERTPAALAGLCGAAAATIVGTLANDSGALLLMVGTAYVLAASGFFWAHSSRT